ncbi:MAG: response regulator [Bacteroidota bacterium]|nr:response regulator [Flavisolibacter sp.]MDQ3844087.1 response regulator [Bacteroidota bacterium]MBD0288374.1 response regulator [Flavisolibacter sp.]MBD0295706.1 response regulator [Flavisolibacter sp.]MBD0351362.1 response regulator [Flavisolibacter sp.]
MKKILVIDDDPDIITVIESLLRRQGYKVATAAQEVDAYKKVEQFVPDLILLDVLLSGVDGREICRRLKASEQFHTIPIIMLSAHPSAQKHIEAYKADDFLAKPFQVPELLQRIKHHLEKKNQSSSNLQL